MFIPENKFYFSLDKSGNERIVKIMVRLELQSNIKNNESEIGVSRPCGSDRTNRFLAFFVRSL